MATFIAVKARPRDAEFVCELLLRQPGADPDLSQLAGFWNLSQLKPLAQSTQGGGHLRESFGHGLDERRMKAARPRRGGC